MSHKRQRNCQTSYFSGIMLGANFIMVIQNLWNFVRTSDLRKIILLLRKD